MKELKKHRGVILMKNNFTSRDKIGDIVSKFPGAADIFKANKIDFCCGGDRQLKLAIQEGNLDETQVLNDLNKKYKLSKNMTEKVDIDWQNSSLSELIDYIVNKHHAYLQENLPRVSELSNTILRVHGVNHQELSKVHKLFHSLKMELKQHLIKEEEILFPIIKKYEEDPSAKQLDKAFTVINELEDEHEGAGDILKELREVSKDYVVPDDGCNTYQLTYQLLEELESDLFQHIHLENNILFPRLEKQKVAV